VKNITDLRFKKEKKINKKYVKQWPRMDEQLKRKFEFKNESLSYLILSRHHKNG